MSKTMYWNYGEKVDVIFATCILQEKYEYSKEKRKERKITVSITYHKIERYSV